MAETGRFISEDPWKGTIIDPKTLNPYPYVQNNPLKYIDPTGMVIEMGPGGEGLSRVTTKTSSPNIVNEVRKEEVKKEVNNTSEWNCRIVTEDVGNLDADYTSAVASTYSLAYPASVESILSAPIVVGVIIGASILAKPNYAGETQEELKNDKEFQQWLLLSETENESKAESEGETDDSNGESQAPTSDRPFKEKLNDINNNPENWEKTKESIINSTKKGNTGGNSIEAEYKNKVTGEKIYKHTLTDVNGRLIEKPHYRPYPKQ